MTTYQLSKTERSFTIGGLTYSIGAVVLKKDGDNLIIGEGVNALKFRYDQLIGISDETFATADLAVTYLEANVFKVGGAPGEGGEIADGSITEVKLDVSVQGKLNDETLFSPDFFEEVEEVDLVTRVQPKASGLVTKLNEIEEPWLPADRIIGATDVSLTRRKMQVVESDFYTETSPFGVGLRGVAISSGSIAAKTSVANHPGIIALRDSTTANGGYAVVSAVFLHPLDGGQVKEDVWRRVSSKTTYQFRIGWAGTITSATPDNGAYLQFDGTTGLITAVNRNAGAGSPSAETFTPVLNTWYSSKIEVNEDGTNVNYKIFDEDGDIVFETNMSANIPLGGNFVGPMVIATESTTDAAADLLELDYFLGYYQNEVNR